MFFSQKSDTDSLQQALEKVAAELGLDAEYVQQVLNAEEPPENVQKALMALYTAVGKKDESIKTSDD
ncbi:MAG: hypothetical protein ACNI27_01915 [Desulfovibrio sp.]